MMHFVSQLAFIPTTFSIIHAASLDFTSFNGDLSSREASVDAVPDVMTRVIDGSLVLAEQPPPYIPPPIRTVGSDHLGDLSKDMIKQANPNSRQSSLNPQDPEMALIIPGSSVPLISSMIPQPESSIRLSSNPFPANVDVDASLSWSAYKDDQSSGSAETSKSVDLATQVGCGTQAAPNNKFRTRQESCPVPKKESVPEQQSVPEQEGVPRRSDRRKRVCPPEAKTFCCEEQGDFWTLWFPKKCKRCE